MSILFTPAKIGNLEIPNRFVRSATYDAGADNGFVSDWQIELYSALAKGHIGLIVSAVFNVRVGKAAPGLNSLTDDKFVPGLRRLADAVHANGSKLAVQVYHAGREAYRVLQPAGLVATGPSGFNAGEDPYFQGTCREMTEEEIWSTVEAFGQAARRIQEAGCDAIQFHGAHAYLLAQFLSPHSNRRRDLWGGGLGNRLKLHREICRVARRHVGPSFPVMIKLGVADGFPGGLEFEEGLEAAAHLANIGYDSIEVSQGLRGLDYRQTEFRPGIIRREREAYFRDWARQVKKRVDVPVMMVGGLRSLDLMQTVVEANEADFVSLSRPLIKEPDLVVSWQAGKARRPKCISCNKCFENVIAGGKLRCMVQAKGKQVQAA
ncbi:MAG: NADH:flavin oxidoreductase [Deltaproteobacteria bacterium]|nr:NADH:flavin oxidoreductase [Deltaproteobacteria bacterium]